MNNDLCEPEWFDEYSNVLRLAKYFVAVESWTAQELLKFFEQPWKWTDKWETIRRSGAL